MTGTPNSANSGRQRICSLLCLFALLLLQVPAVSAAVIAATGACCSTDNCPIAAHHHPTPAKTAPANTEDASMNCDHESHSAGKIRSCSMSCCKTVEQSAIHGHFFLLSPVAALAAFAPISKSLSAVAASEPSGFVAPFSPPPESL